MMSDDVRIVTVDIGAEARAVKLESSQQVRDTAPSAYGVFGIVYDGELVSYKYLDSKKEQQKLSGLLNRA